MARLLRPSALDRRSPGILEGTSQPTFSLRQDQRSGEETSNFTSNRARTREHEVPTITVLQTDNTPQQRNLTVSLRPKRRKEQKLRAHTISQWSADTAAQLRKIWSIHSIRATTSHTPILSIARRQTSTNQLNQGYWQNLYTQENSELRGNHIDWLNYISTRTT